MLAFTINGQPLDAFLIDLQSKVLEIDAKISKLEFDVVSAKQNQESEKIVSSEYKQLKEEILEEVNLIVSDLMAGV